MPMLAEQIAQLARAEAELKYVDEREKEYAATCARWRRAILDQWQAAITGLRAETLEALPARIRDISAKRLEVAKAMLYGGTVARGLPAYLTASDADFPAAVLAELDSYKKG